MIAFVALAATRMAPRSSPESQSRTAPETKTPSGVEIVEHGGYPELRVDGAPFFIHSASFFYYRIPRDQWESLLRNYHSNGINTLDLYIPWNWHEPKEDEFDFDGHTNPRRNLRALLALIAQEGFKLIARPGPEILNEWRHGGYPGWLLERPEYKMSTVDWLEGRYPPLDALNTSDAEAAAEGWLENPTHMAHARAWLTAVAKELAPFSSHRLWRNPEQSPGATPHESSGPLLFVQLGDDFAIGRTNRTGPEFWRYLESLRSAVEAGGVDLPVFINPTDMRVSAAGSALERPIGVMGQWYMRRRETDESGERLLTASDAGEIEFFTEELKTQPAFPPVMIEYQAGWYAPADDDRPLMNPQENTLLSSRLLLGNGMHGFNYLPLQDTYTLAGYSVPWANRTYRWDAALGPDGNQQPRLHAVRRNSALLHHWGPQLAASHKRPDFGIAYPLGAYPQGLLSRQDILRVSDSVMRIERLATLAMLSSELVDPAYQTVEQLLRDPMILLPVFDPSRPQFQLSDRAQRTIVAYVRQGGTAVIFPERPAGSILDELWKTAPEAEQPAANTAIRAHWKFGAGEVIESTKEFFSWVALDRGFAENRDQPEAAWAISVLREFIMAGGLRPAVVISGKPTGASQLIANEIITNEGTELLGERDGGQGFLSITNLASSITADTYLEVLAPRASARGNHTDYLPLHVTLPPRESLLLPLQTSLCFSDPPNAPCPDDVVEAGAEFLEAQRDGKSLVLLFYAPARAEISLHLALKPSNVALDNVKPEVAWDDSENALQVTVPRGMAPQFHRVLKIDLPDKPHVPEVEKPPKFAPSDLGYFVANALRLPVSQGAFLRTYPPLVLLESKGTSAVVLQAENFNFGEILSMDVSIEGPLHGSGILHVFPRNSSVEKIELKPSSKEMMAIAPAADGFIHGTIELHVKNDRRKFPVAFLQPATSGTNHYRYDFDRDGADEWVLENASMRMIASPESGGQIIALVDKSSGANLSTSIGLLRDAFSFAENQQGAEESRAHGRYGLFNRTYAAEWQTDPPNPALKLHYDAPSILPAGARIEKTIQFERATALRVDYRVALNAVNAAAAAPPIPSSQSFVALNSFPAAAGHDRETRFCWQAATVASSTPPADSTKSESKESAKLQCEDFAPQGKTIDVPAGTTRVEIETPGRPTISIEWDCTKECAHMTIEPKNFSALFRLKFPTLMPGGESGQYTLRIRMLAAP
jgi:glycosyl hydrolase family 35